MVCAVNNAKGVVLSPGTLTNVPKTCSSMAVAGFDATGDDVTSTVSSLLSMMDLSSGPQWLPNRTR